jgi:hypothetical protein
MENLFLEFHPFRARELSIFFTRTSLPLRTSWLKVGIIAPPYMIVSPPFGPIIYFKGAKAEYSAPPKTESRMPL